MMSKKQIMIDGNEAAAHVAFKCSEVVAIYPITPSSGMGEWADDWAAKGQKNIWDTTPLVSELQSEGGAAGAVHGALQRGALTTTFTASQGLLLMIPNMFKIAGELTSTVFHVAARSVATHALSIFGDHSDVMATRGTGFALLSSGSIQEVMDLALISHAASLESRIPFVHFFDGFRSSHEIAKIDQVAEDDIKQMISDDLVLAHRARALSPDNPVVRGTAQNPDVFFQARETVNPYYNKCAGIVEKAMQKFEKITGRKYELFQYFGAKDAERVIVLMGSGVETAQETIEYLTSQGEKVGVMKVRLYRPFSIKHLVDALPATTKTIGVLDRTKEPGASEPLYLDVIDALVEGGAAKFKTLPKVIGGRYGLSSKEFTPAMIKGLLDEMTKDAPKNHFTLGINDDVTKTSLEYDPNFSTENPKGVRAVFYGLGSDGTVGANKNSIKIIGENTPNYAQGYFVYDSKKAGAMTVSHLRFGPEPIHSPYLISRANFLGCHQFVFVEKYNILKHIDQEGVFLLNSYYGKDEVWDNLPKPVQQQIIDKKIKFYAIDAYKVAEEAGMGGRINTIMQTCFFAISGVLPKEQAIEEIKKAIKKAYGKKGEEVVQMNFNAVDKAIENMNQIEYPDKVTSTIDMPPAVSAQAPEFVQNVTAKIMQACGDDLPVSVFPIDGTFPTATTQWEKRNIALQIPVWEKDICIQCGKCSVVCPHAVIRAKVYDPKGLEGAPETFKHIPAKDKDLAGNEFTLQVAPEDCTGCGLCVTACPAKSKENPELKAINMHSQPPLREKEVKNWEFFCKIPRIDRSKIKTNVRGAQFLEPLFEFSGACAGCGETPYVRLVSQLFGDRMVVANATGCSSIYGGNLPTTPWSKNAQGKGPAWSNSLFEDNAEFGLGFRLAIDKQKQYACELVKKLEGKIGGDLTKAIIEANQIEEPDIFEQRERVETLKEKIKDDKSPEAIQLMSVADTLVKKSVWIMGGDGWAYDIGYGGLDHVLASGFDVNFLVLDTEVYSNTGGQMSKATPRGAIAKFAAAGKPAPKKDLARMIMSYGNVYVANVAIGARDEHTVKALLEAEHYPGPSLVIAYSHCIAHGIDMGCGLQYQKDAVNCGYWPLFRFNPLLKDEGKNPLIMDSQAPKMTFEEYALKENRFRSLMKADPERAKMLFGLAQQDVDERWAIYQAMASEAFTPKQKEG
ncbi:MAG: pyruvate:ferredoxin (flavodoxin) oxidoreductase [Candidatus Aceula meridiana]|nr:pyruvate:ferredoxin (flavodoxin) oxidoreductase [Candidatus Aceula meridiana]